MKLIAIPFAGGMGNEFKSWQVLIDEEVELITIQYPGRGERKEEPYITEFETLLEDIFRQVKAVIADDEEYLLFGHSMGCIFAYELYFKLKENGYILPKHVFFSGNFTPKECLKDEKKSELVEEKFRDYFMQLGGISMNVLEDEKMSQELFKRLRCDVCALESYIYKPREEQIECNVSVLNGMQDYFVSSQLSWEKILHKTCIYKCYQGDHFFIFKQKQAVVAYIQEIVLKLKQAPIVYKEVKYI
ncbi:thioesterase II family protein [Cellulosilyticum ruminicola]|uniref:thioesterase II family protein n=1 Tax=Cellulosilyticum ruminicola TaxID=425254 RepID=UPI0006D1F003|nr:thioesterase domain-containing protein [Cellulosilyticum ruminicola]